MYKLLEHCRSGRIVLLVSNAARRELERTKSDTIRDALLRDFLECLPVWADEKVLGFAESSDRYGGHISFPLVSDVQDEALCQQLQQELGLQLADAQHLAQAISNQVDGFLTRDTDFIDEPKHTKPRRTEHMRALIEKRYPIKIRRPSELITELR
jgi:predicted nucleic acid-binding protein